MHGSTNDHAKGNDVLAAYCAPFGFSGLSKGGDGLFDGTLLGVFEGVLLGVFDGLLLGLWEGLLLGLCDGVPLAVFDGVLLGVLDGVNDGWTAAPCVVWRSNLLLLSVTPNMYAAQICAG